MSDLTPRDRLVREMELRLMAEVERRRRSARRKRWAAFGMSGAILCVAVSAWFWLGAPLFAERGALCYSAPDTSSSHREAGFADGAAGREVTVEDPESKALDICGAMWASGVLGDPDLGRSLFVCRDNDGTLQVFPRVPGEPSTCRALGTNEPKK